MLRERALLDNVALVAVVESHLRDDIRDAEVHMEGFQLFRADRLQGIKKGGVAVFARNDLAAEATILSSGSNGVVEHLVLWFAHLRLVIVVIYRPPTCEMSKFEPVLSDIASIVERLGRPLPSLIVMGDFNFPSMNWSTYDAYGGTRESRVQSASLVAFMEQFALEQYVNVPTRLENILDLFLTNNCDLVREVKVEDTQLSDHRLIFVHWVH